MWLTIEPRIAVLCLAAVTCPILAHTESKPITDEGLRQIALRAIFPGMAVSRDVASKIDASWRENPPSGEFFSPDALSSETVYRVIGKASNQAESTASEDMKTETFSDVRRVRLKLFYWPRAKARRLLALVQYDFAGANPAMSCPSIGLLVALAKTVNGWSVGNRYLLETSHHSSIQKIQLLDLTGDDIDDLVVESDFGGAGAAGSTLQVFDLSHERFEELLHANSRLEFADEEGYTQFLDEERTKNSQGRQFCVSKTILFEKGRWFDPPHILSTCYSRGYGVDRKAARNRNRMLAPPN